MKSANQAIENVEYVRRLLEQKQPEFAASLECTASLVETQPREPTDDELIRRCSAAVRVACLRMNPRYLKALRDSVEQARRMPSRFASGAARPPRTRRSSICSPMWPGMRFRRAAQRCTRAHLRPDGHGRAGRGWHNPQLPPSAARADACT